MAPKGPVQAVQVYGRKVTEAESRFHFIEC